MNTTYGEKLNQMVAVLREYHPDATKLDLVEMARHIYDVLVGDAEPPRPMGEAQLIEAIKALPNTTAIVQDYGNGRGGLYIGEQRGRGTRSLNITLGVPQTVQHLRNYIAMREAENQ